MLSPGGIAYIINNADGSTSVRGFGRGASGEPLADLGAAAIHVAVSPDGRRFAFERGGQSGIFLQQRGSRAAVRISGGSLPRFSPDGARIMSLSQGGTDIRELDGRLVAHLASPAAAWVQCGSGCAR
jgi:hypothetical protein